MDPITQAAREAIAPVPPEVWVTYYMFQGGPDETWQAKILNVFATQEAAKEYQEARIGRQGFVGGEPVVWGSTKNDGRQLRSQMFTSQKGVRLYYFVLPREVE